LICSNGLRFSILALYPECGWAIVLPDADELNPDEQVWHDLKSNGIGRSEIADRDDLETKGGSGVRSILFTFEVDLATEAGMIFGDGATFAIIGGGRLVSCDQPG
jgi:hypothetical protein